METKAPETAFASYASHDRRDVIGRIRSLQIFTGIDVFLDCLSIRPGEKWKEQIRREISRRDIFWLFWSRHAKESQWVEWEWRTALHEKSIHGIQPHPIDPPDIAPPPAALADLQFGSIYETYINQLKGRWFNRRGVKIRKILRNFPTYITFTLFCLLLIVVSVTAITMIILLLNG